MAQSARPPIAAAPLDLLLQAGRILKGDYLAGRAFAFVARRRNRARYRPVFERLIAALDEAGGRHMVEAVVLDGQMPRSPRGQAELEAGLDALARAWRRYGLPIRWIEPADGGRPVARLKRVAA